MGSTVVDLPPRKAVSLHIQHSQSMRLVRTANKDLSLICGMLIFQPCETLITAHVIWCFIIICFNGIATEMKSQAYAPTWHYGPCLPRLQPIRNFFASGSRDFFGTQTVKKDVQLLSIFCRGLGFRYWVMLTVTTTPNIIYNC